LVTEILVTWLLILANGVFSGAEIAIVSLRPTRVKQLVERNRPGAHALAALRAQPERFLASVQIGITVVSTTAAAIGGARIARHIVPMIAALPWIADEAEQIALALVVIFVSFLSLVFGELVPKSLALRAAETYALLAARLLLALSFAARPFVWLLTGVSNVVLRPFADRTNFLEVRVTREELEDMVGEAGETGTLHEQASELASRAMAFDRLALHQVMVPRTRIEALPKTASPDEIRRFVLEERRSRIPVYDGAFDNIVGYVSAKDLVAIAWEGQLIVLADVMRPIKLFPESMLAIEVLRFMRREHERIAMVVDEHGAVAGMVTFEDLVEELVGNVFSEHEEQVPFVERAPDGSAVVRGDAPIRDVNRELALALPESEGATTIAGLCARLAGGIPNRNARLAADDGTVLVVVDASPRSVRRVRVLLPRGA
jgi:putative hemolysin